MGVAVMVAAEPRIMAMVVNFMLVVWCFGMGRRVGMKEIIRLKVELVVIWSLLVCSTTGGEVVFIHDGLDGFCVFFLELIPRSWQ